MKKLDKLILGSFLGPFLLTFIVVDFILLTVNMLKYFDEIFGKGLSFWIYMELIGYFVISISPMALPLAVLLSSLMTFGNLGEHFELTAIKSSGISLLRALQPIGIFVITLSFAAYLSNNYLVPKVNLKTFSLLYDIRMKSPALDIKAGVFYAGIPGYSIKVNEKVGENGLKDILIYNHSSGRQGNLNVTLADSGRMEPFFNENYMKLTLYHGKNYEEARQSRGIREKPVEFNRTTFDVNEIVFDLNSFKLNRTAEDAWSTNRSIKNISEIRVGLDSINTLVNDKLHQSYLTAEGIYPFFTRDRKLKPLPHIAARKERDDSIRAEKSRREKELLEKNSQEAEEDTVLDTLENDKLDPAERRLAGGISTTEQSPNAVTAAADVPVTDSLFQDEDLTTPERTAADSARIKRIAANKKKPELRTAPLTAAEYATLDSMVTSREYERTAINMALSNSRNLKNTFAIKKSEVENYQREFRRYEIAWFQKYTQAFACFAMFLIGAPLGAIIKKGGLGMPVLVSIIFFIVYYMLTITGEKWAKEGMVDSFFGTAFSNLCLLPFGLFFVKQARKDARLFEPDFYVNIWNSIRKRVKLLQSKEK
ncbi:LptF/LptG family permease [Algoriphagus halophytocola]|uniref:LptF/LptG family permease n=1 Tax=Algoriphagus halophytocola TaxID=2991499 RepID=A0ABY6MIA3_9BACT|nr:MULTISPECIES: LptF/LptG family permease [unclassified Algoriphagus]UZD23505.1 LptF/LptG family permease [Algoriphagus sp. TR-M5]WBL44799.1 LptF/LptG family permease [Algoriphagus sp. TR-M9]